MVAGAGRVKQKHALFRRMGWHRAADPRMLPRKMSLLSAHGIEKGYGVHRVLAGVSVTIAAGERIGLVGDNGSGKSTLARVMGKLEPPDVGSVMQQKGSRIGYLPQVPVLDEGLTALEAALEGLERWRAASREHDAISKSLAAATGESERAVLLERQATALATIERLGGWDQEHRAKGILQRLNLGDVSARVSTLSGGERRRVALAALLLSEPDVLILDEPTNHLDTESIDWLETYLEDTFEGALLVITHDRYFLDRVVTRTWEIDAGVVAIYEGGWEAYLTAKAERQAIEARTEANRQNFLRTELEWLRRQPKARGTKQKARIGRAETAIDSGPRAGRQGLQFETTSARQGSEVLVFEKVGFRYGERPIIEGLDLIATPGQRIGVLGPNGAGKTTLLGLITEKLAPSAGKMRLGKNTRIGYFAQTRSDLDEAATVAENVAGLRQTLSVGGYDITVYSYLERFSFRGEEIRKKVGVLSGGERARVALAKLLVTPANLLLLDEPTNDLDITTMGALEQMLCEFAGSVLVVSHDRYFLDRVATSLLVFEGGGKVQHYVGDYGTYSRLRRERAEQERAAAAEPSKAAAPAATGAAKRSAKLSYKEERELAGIEKMIEDAEADVRRIEAELADPELYRRDAVRAGALGTQLSAAQARVQSLMDRWQELESKREAFEAGR
jgi:ATP-binding cassette subfamily F protein uup